MFDTLTMFKSLVDSGLPEKQAEAYVYALVDLKAGKFDETMVSKRLAESGYPEQQVEVIVSALRNVAANVMVTRWSHLIP